jgi:hypothetical protein
MESNFHVSDMQEYQYDCCQHPKQVLLAFLSDAIPIITVTHVDHGQIPWSFFPDCPGSCHFAMVHMQLTNHSQSQPNRLKELFDPTTQMLTCIVSAYLNQGIFDL